MRIIVISDTHGSMEPIESVFLRNEDASWFIHLGDGEKELRSFIVKYPQFTRKIIHVCGNCDFGSLSQNSLILPIAGHRIFCTHGHNLGVKGSLNDLKRAAKENNCDIVLFGHTHVRYNKTEDGLYILNPGSTTTPNDGMPPSFGHIDISDAGVVMNIANV